AHAGQALVRMGLICAIFAWSALFVGPDKARAEPTQLTYALYDDIKDWDPAVAFSLEVAVLANVYETLVRYDPEVEGQVVPALAESWSVSEDGLTWRFKLRDGVQFHDGSALTAQTVKKSLERTIELNRGASYIWSGVEAIDAPSDLVLTIRTRVPEPVDLIASAQYGAYIVSSDAADNETAWFSEGRAVGTGPYQLIRWDRNQQIVLERHTDYWGGTVDSDVDRVIYRIVREAATQAQMIRTGAADVITLTSVAALRGFERQEDIVVDLVPSWTNAQFLINTGKYPTDNRLFRQALLHAWDYENVATGVYDGAAEVARGIIPKTMWGHDPALKVPDFDLEEAKRLLEASGVPEKDWRLTASFIGTSVEYTNALLLYQLNLAKLGVRLTLKPGPWGKIWDEAKNPRTAPHLQSMTWWPTYPTPADWLVSLFRTEDAAIFNLSHYSNPAFDSLVDQGRALEVTDREGAIALYQQAQQLLIDDAVGIFYADIRSRLIYRRQISGIRPNPAYATIFIDDLVVEP
ncbi:MAG: ABC transporter substrate-binding protein, partial [Pseudomonadota bacterium]